VVEAEDEAEEELEAEEPVFFAVGVPKLLVMCVFTLGLYGFYWFFRNWQLVCRRTGREAFWGPLLRTIATVFFCYPLFKRIDRALRAERLPGIYPGWTAIAYIALGLSWKLSDPWWSISLLQLVVLARVQAGVQRLNREVVPEVSANRRLSVANWAVCAVCTFLAVGGIVASPSDELVLEDDSGYED